MDKGCFWILLLANFVFNVSCRPHNWAERVEMVKRDVGDEVTEDPLEGTGAPGFVPVPIVSDSKWHTVINELSRLNHIFAVMNAAEKRLEAFWTQVEEDVKDEMERYSQLQRSKRHTSNDSPLIRDTEGFWTIEQWSSRWTQIISKNWKIILGTLSMTPFVHKNMIFWITTSIYHHTGQPGVTGIYMMTIVGGQEHVQYVKIIGTQGANKCIPILMNDWFIEIVCAESFRGDSSIKASQRGSCVIRVTWTDGALVANVIRNLATRNAVDVSSLSDGNVIYIAYAGHYDMIRQSYETSSAVIRVTV